MLKLGRFVMLVVAVAAGIGVLINTLPWLSWRQDGTPMPTGTETRWVLFALGLGAALLARHLIGQMQRARNADELESLKDGSTFEARGGLGWLPLNALLAVLCALGTWFSVRKDEWGMAAMAFVLLVLFVLVTWQTVRHLLRPGPMLRMDVQGIDHALYGPIPWSDVVGISLATIKMRYGQKQHTLQLGVRGARRYMRNAPPLTRWLQSGRLKSTYGVGALFIPLDPLSKDAELIHQSALALRAQHDAPFLKFWTPDMDAQEVGALLRMTALNEESERLTADMHVAMETDDPDRHAALAARLKAHSERHSAALPHLRVAMEKRSARIKRDVRIGWLLLALLVGWLILSIIARLMK